MAQRNMERSGLNRQPWKDPASSYLVLECLIMPLAQCIVDLYLVKLGGGFAVVGELWAPGGH